MGCLGSTLRGLGFGLFSVRLRGFKARRQEFWSGFRNFGSVFEDLALGVEKSGQPTSFFAADFAIKTNISRSCQKCSSPLLESLDLSTLETRFKIEKIEVQSLSCAYGSAISR